MKGLRLNGLVTGEGLNIEENGHYWFNTTYTRMEFMEMMSV